MDFTFSSKLQTHLQNLGRKNGFAPPKSQDPADEILHEYFVSETARSLFDKRRKKALEALKRLDLDREKIPEALKAADKGQFGSVQLFDTEHYNATLTVKQPVIRIDTTILANELIKLGVDTSTVTKALKAAEVKNKPAETYTVVPKST